MSVVIALQARDGKERDGDGWRAVLQLVQALACAQKTGTVGGGGDLR